MRVVGVVAQLCRHPVKSMGGEHVDALELSDEGVPFDRVWGVRDSETGIVLTARTARPLLHASAALDGDAVAIALPDGRVLHEDDLETDLALSRWLGRPVHLARAKSDESVTFDAPGDPLDDRSARVRWPSMTGTFNDGHPVHLLTDASVRDASDLHPAGAWVAARFRPNVVIATDARDFPEERWTRVRIGDVRVEVYKRTTRCAITARSQPGLLDDLGIPRTLAHHRNAKLGVYARVTAPGTVRLGDDVVVVDGA